MLFPWQETDLREELLWQTLRCPRMLVTGCFLTQGKGSQSLYFFYLTGHATNWEHLWKHLHPLPRLHRSYCAPRWACARWSNLPPFMPSPILLPNVKEWWGFIQDTFQSSEEVSTLMAESLNSNPSPTSHQLVFLLSVGLCGSPDIYGRGIRRQSVP